MKPNVIIHNSISLDGSLLNFEVNMGLHYQIAGSFKPQVHLIGSNTIKKGIELYGGKVPSEEKSDFEKPKRDKKLPYWAIVDTRASLKGLLHTCRRFEMCRDVILLLSKKTPKSYIKHLEERKYEYHIVGEDRVDLKKALELLSKKYGAKTVLTDTGKILGNLLLNLGLVDKVSLLLHPFLVGDGAYPMFGDINKKIQLRLIKNERMGKEYLWLVYEVLR